VSTELKPLPRRRRITRPLSFNCTMVPSSRKSEQKTVELLRWLLSISRNQIGKEQHNA
jgi:hypothetical protein